MTMTSAAIRRESARRIRWIETRIGEDIRRIRLDASVSLAALGRATDIDPAYIGRIEAGVEHPSLEILTAIGVALGADLSVRYFAGAGPRIHDRFQAPMLGALLTELHPRWKPELEVVVRNPVHGFIDAVLRDPLAGLAIATEVQSDLQRLEQQIRWSREKADGLTMLHAETRVSQLLVLRSTVRTRGLARQYEALLRAAFPGRTADAVAALTAGKTSWPGASLVWMHLHGSTASLMRHPPPGVALGR
jgi:transcriptional regulator with XRE-family HTH domain